MYNEDGLEQAEEVISVVFFFLSGNQVLFLFQQLEDSLSLWTHGGCGDEAGQGGFSSLILSFRLI